MNPAGKALWYIESHFAGEITLEDVARVAGVSRYHLARAFEAATGWSVMRYTRARRLSDGARPRASGASDILSVALDAGYGSHEAFTRAFRDQFGVTPEDLRSRCRLDSIRTVEAIRMDESLLEGLETPRLGAGRQLLIAGLGARYNDDTCTAIPSQWQRFIPSIGQVPGQIGSVAYGVRCNSDDAGNMDYICGVEVADFSRLGPEWS